MKKSCLLTLAIAAAAVSSCSTVSHEATVATVDTKIVSMTVGDLNVSKKKASATAEWKWTPFNAVKPSEISLAATAKLLKENNADVVIEPTTEIKRRGLFRGGSVTVTGYPATYTGFHPLTEKEAQAYATARLCPTATASSFLNPLSKLVKPKAKPAKVRKERKPFRNGSFLNATYGFVSQKEESKWTDDTYKTGTIGLVYGHYCKNRWGWYIRANFDWGAGYNSDHLTYRSDWYWGNDGESCNDSHRQHGGTLGAGALYGFSNKFGIFAGAGIGTAIVDYRPHSIEAYGCESADKRYGDLEVGLPFEAGIDLRFGALNIMAGYRYTYVPEYSYGKNLSTVFLGLGINF